MSLIRAIPSNPYMIAPSLQQGFIDKDSGQLLAFGYVNFFRDADHSARKPIFTVSGPPDSPVYTQLPNPLFLSAIGTFQDPNNNQDIIPYYYPFDANGNIDLYYIEVYSAGNILQFTRDHYPSVDSGGTDLTSTELNLIPNGQFLMHVNNFSITSSTISVPIAFGGWIFAQTQNTTANNVVTFPRYNAPLDIPDQNPRYSCRISCANPNPADTQKDLQNIITDVNFLQGQVATIGITAYSNDGNNHNVTILIGDYFGVGGSPYVENEIGTILITPEIQSFTIPFTMASTIGKTLGSQDDDYIAVIFRSPLSTSSDISYTDVIMVSGTFSVLSYIPTSPAQAKAFALAGSFDLPNPDGSDNGRLVSIGISNQDHNLLGFSYANGFVSPWAVQTGTHFAYVGEDPPDGYLLEDGSNYAVQSGNTLPSYPDLFNTIFGSSPPGSYAFGTGINGFTWNNDNSDSTKKFVQWNRFDIAQPAPNAGTSGFTFTLTQGVVPNTQHQIYHAAFTAGSAITAGSYFTLPVNTTGLQYIQLFWFRVNGNGTAPSITFDVAVAIDISSTMTTTQVANQIQIYANGLWQVPDLRGLLIKYWNHNSGRDENAASRLNSQNPAVNLGHPLYYSTGNSNDNIGSTYQDIQPWDTTTSFPVCDIYFNGIIKT